MPSTALPWWQVNVPDHLRSEACPDFLVDCNEKDRRIIGTPNSEYTPYSWQQVKDIVNSNRLGDLVRKPSELRRYRHYTWELVNKYGSIVNFVQHERLKWHDLTPRGPPFSNPGWLFPLSYPRCADEVQTTSRSCTTTGRTASTKR